MTKKLGLYVKIIKRWPKKSRDTSTVFDYRLMVWFGGLVFMAYQPL